MSPKTLIVVGNLVATVLGGLATANTFPALTPVFSAVAGLLVGLVNVQKPGTAAKIEAALMQEPPK